MAHDAIEAHCCFHKSTGEQDTTVNDNSTAFQHEVLCQLLTETGDSKATSVLYDLLEHTAPASREWEQALPKL